MRPKGGDRSAGKAESKVGNFLFRSKWANGVWDFSTASPFYVVRLVGAVLISVVLVGRCGRLFLHTRLANRRILGFILVGTFWSGLWPTFVAGSIVGILYLFYQQLRQPTINSGHRAGGKGFKGPFVENTLEALKNLIREDKEGRVKDLHYVEFDVHETSDGELLILHDLDSVLNAARNKAINADALGRFGYPEQSLEDMKVKDVKARTIQDLHLGGIQDVHIPTLQQFLNCCKQEGLRRSIAVEVKEIYSDQGRQKFLDLLKDYKNSYCAKLEASCPQNEYNSFGWVSAISFPFNWAQSFGEFCQPEWKKWADAFNQAGIPVRSCVLHSLDLVPGA